MNPLSGTLTRLGFLLWSILLIICLLGFARLNNVAETHYFGAWMSERLVIAAIIAIISIVVSLRRLQNAGLSSWLVILAIPPVFSSVFWVILLFIPPKSKKLTNYQPMNKNQKGFVLWFLPAAIAVVIVITGAYVIYRHHQSSTAQTAQNTTTSCNLGSCCDSKPIPGVIEIHVAANTDKQAIEALIKPIHGKLSIYYNTVENNSDYHEIDVPKGTETKAMSYLKKQPQVIDTWQESNLCPN